MQELIIKPTKKLSINLKEMLAYHELFFYFAWRDVKVRYKQTSIGILWAVLQPFIQMVVFTLFFNKAAGIGTGNSAVPYAIFSFTGLLFWNFFSQSLTRASNSLVDNQSVVTKVYFPRLLLPLTSTLVGLIDFAFAFLVFIGLMIFFRISPTLNAVLFLVPVADSGVDPRHSQFTAFANGPGFCSHSRFGNLCAEHGHPPGAVQNHVLCHLSRAGRCGRSLVRT